MTPDQYCQEKTAKSGSSFYYSFIFLPEQQRQAITALYAFCREVDDIVDEVHEEAVAKAKLAWWREEIGRVYQQKATHPIGHALTTALTHYKLKQVHFDSILTGMEMDLTQFSYANFDALSEYCYNVASVVGLLSVEIFGYQDDATLQYAEQLGLALQLTNIIRDVREDAERGRIYLPEDELAAHHVSIDDILALKQTPELETFLKTQAERAQHYYDQAFALLPDCDRYTQRTGLIMANIYRATLAEISQDNFQVMQQRVSLTPLRKLWIAWRTARHQKRWQVKTI